MGLSFQLLWVSARSTMAGSHGKGMCGFVRLPNCLPKSLLPVLEL